jgi:hypothetical protein
VIFALAFAAVPVFARLLDRVTFDVPLGSETRMEGSFSIALGTVTIGDAAPGHLFQAVVNLQDDRLQPQLSVTRRDDVARVELELDNASGSGGVSIGSLRGRSQNTWELAFRKDLPLDLSFDLGLADASLDFGGFQVERLVVNAGMATAHLSFDEPNPIVMQHLQIDAGAARFTGSSLGNARFERMVFRGGAGSFTLDFGGAVLPAGARADIDVGVSRLRIRLPEDKPVVLHAPDSWLTRVSVPRGYTRAGRDRWHSASVGDPAQAFHVNISAGVGRVSCETFERPAPPPRPPRPPVPPPVPSR